MTSEQNKRICEKTACDVRARTTTARLRTMTGNSKTACVALLTTASGWRRAKPCEPSQAWRHCLGLSGGLGEPWMRSQQWFDEDKPLFPAGCRMRYSASFAIEHRGKFEAKQAQKVERRKRCNGECVSCTRASVHQKMLARGAGRTFIAPFPGPRFRKPIFLYIFYIFICFGATFVSSPNVDPTFVHRLLVD